MHIRMVRGPETVEWTLIKMRTGAEAKQVDSTGTWRVAFDSQHTAGMWIIHQAQFMQEVAGFQYAS